MKTPNRWDGYVPPADTVYRFRVHIACVCGERLTIEAHGADDEPGRQERAALVSARATARGWSIEGDRHRCPTCAIVQFADGTAPGTERLHGERCMCAGAGCMERPSR